MDWNIIYRGILTLSWLIFVATMVTLTYVVSQVLANMVTGNKKMQDTKDALQRLEQFIPSLKSREVELAETVEMFRARARALDHLIEQAEREKRSHGTE